MGTRHLGWIAAWGVPGVLAGSAMIAYWLAAADPTRELPLWPLWPLGLATALCLYMVFAPLIHAPPFRRKREPATLPTQQLNMDMFEQLREATRPPDLESDESPEARGDEPTIAENPEREAAETVAAPVEAKRRHSGIPSFAAEIQQFGLIERDYDGSDDAKAEVEEWIEAVRAKLEAWSPRQAKRFITWMFIDNVGPFQLIFQGRGDDLADPHLKRLHVYRQHLRDITGQ